MEISYGEAIREALNQNLQNDESIVLFGQDIQHNVYGYTGNLLNKYGEKRIINVPLSESAVVGTAIGAAMCGLRTIVDLTVANFLYVAMDQIVNMASKSAYMYDGQFKLPITIMCSTLYNTASGSQHSDRPHSMFMNVPGLKIVAPSKPQDAYSLLIESINDNNPVLYFSDRSIFYKKEEVNLNTRIEIGKANVLKNGNDITIITISGCTQIALDVYPELKNKKISAEIIDVRTLVPLDILTIKNSVKKTGRVIIVDTANRTSSAASEISSRIAEDMFHFLKAPISIISYDDVPVPYAQNLEQIIMPTKAKIYDKVNTVLKQY